MTVNPECLHAMGNTILKFSKSVISRGKIGAKEMHVLINSPSKLPLANSIVIATKFMPIEGQKFMIDSLTSRNSCLLNHGNS